MTENLGQRIKDLHAWYQRNVMDVRLTPEVERLWFDWFKAGYNGHDLSAVIRYIRKQIRENKRNPGALKLSNLLERSESGFLKFDEDLGLARARWTDKRLEPVPGDPSAPPPPGRRQSPASPPKSCISDQARNEMARQIAQQRQKL